MRSRIKPVFAALGCILLVVSLSTSCGDFFPSSSAIVSITISPSNPSVAKSTGSEQFTAQGTFGNNTTGDVTGQVNWSSSNAAVATITQAGLATILAGGTSTITAKSSDASATTTLSVLDITTITISVVSGGTTLAAGGTAQMKAVDQSGNDVTSSITWNTSDSSILSVSSTGLVTASSLTLGGNANVTATFGSITSNSITFTVSAG